MVYAENTVPHMMSGAAVNRAIRAHDMNAVALYSILLNDAISTEDKEDLKDCIQSILKGETCLRTLASCHALKKVSSVICQKQETLVENKTACLWFVYLDMLSLLRRFLRATGLGYWNAHISTLEEMMPYFAACGHNNYLKSVWLYLQNMMELKESNPSVYSKFQNGYFTIRRADKKMYDELPCDLVIEQTLMRPLKSR